MSAVIFHNKNAVFQFEQKEVKELIVRKKSEYDLDEVTKLLEHISHGSNERIVIAEEPIYFKSIALDMLDSDKGSAVCKTCSKRYLAWQLKPIKVGYGGNPFDIKREKKGVIKRLFTKKRKTPAMFGGRGYDCPEGHNLISVITWKTF